MTREIEFRLLEHASDDGALLATDAVNLIAAFKELAYRLTRSVADRPGLGRTDAVLERLATVRVALKPGSTRVVFVVGDDAALVDPVAESVDDAFDSIVAGIEANTRPAGVSDSVADSVDRLVVAVTKAAPRIVVTVSGRPPRMITTSAIRRAPWQDTTTDGAAVTVIHGVLEMVDLRTSRFRLRDVVGNRIDLHDVVDAAKAAHLVGARVTASGVLVMGHGTHHHRMERPTIAEERTVEGRLGIEESAPLEQLIEKARAAPTVPAMDLPDEEWEAFLAEIHG